MKQTLALVLCLLAAPLLAYNVGDVVPDATLMTYKGQKLGFSSFLEQEKKRNLLLVFFRTGTCNICVTQLREIAARIDAVKQSNATVLAVSLDDAIVQAKTSELIESKIPIMLDPDGKLIKSFGIYNPADKLSKPSLFLLDSNRKVLYKYVGKGLQDRPPTPEVMKVLEHYSGLAPRAH